MVLSSKYLAACGITSVSDHSVIVVVICTMCKNSCQMSKSANDALRAALASASSESARWFGVARCVSVKTICTVSA